MAQPAPVDKMITIIGAGIAGLSLGWKLAGNGHRVTILERGIIASGASGAAGAYLEPRPGKGKLRALEWASHKLWPEFAKILELEAGINIGFHNNGVTYIAYPEGLEKLKKTAEFHRASNWQVNWMDGKVLREFEPQLSKEIAAAYHLPQVCQVDARLVCKALALAFKQCGGELIEYFEVSDVENTDEGLVVNGKNHAPFSTDKLIISAGHGANKIAGLPNDIPVSRPVRGLMLELAQAKGQAPICRPIKRPDGVILPLPNGNLLVGSSHEEGEEAIIAPDQIVNSMLESAARVVPGIADLPLVETRIGVRALVGDGLLRLGRSGEMRNVYYSLSHAGAGFLRAPIISEKLAHIIVNPDAECSFIAPFYQK